MKNKIVSYSHGGIRVSPWCDFGPFQEVGVLVIGVIVLVVYAVLHDYFVPID